MHSDFSQISFLISEFCVSGVPEQDTEFCKVRPAHAHCPCYIWGFISGVFKNCAPICPPNLLKGGHHEEGGSLQEPL